jgi:acyl-CoA thioester hydrolase
MFLGKPGRSSLQSFYEMRKVGEEALYAEGAAKMVWMNPRTGKSVPIPESILQSIAS